MTDLKQYMKINEDLLEKSFKNVEDGIGKGSGRSIEGFDLHDALTNCTDLLLKFGGHEMAIGLSIAEENIEKFAEKVEKIANEKGTKDLQATVKVDAEITSEDISYQTIQEIELLKPFGEANPAPVFAYRNVKVDGVRLLSNGKHMKLTLKDGMNIFDAIAFNIENKEYNVKIGDKIDVLHAIETNTFNGIEKIQLNVKDIKKSL